MFGKEWASTVSLNSNVLTNLVRILIGLALLTYTVLLAFSAPYDHDENQFVASSALLLREGKQPYIDYPYFHMPYGVYINAIASIFTGQYFVPIRILTSLFWGIAFYLIFIFLLNPSNKSLQRENFILALGLLLIIIFDDSATKMVGLAFNHAIPHAVSILATILLIRTSGKQTPKINLFMIGLLIGLATGVRLNFALLIVPFTIYTYIRFNSDYKYLYYLFGLLIALLPAFIIFLQSPQQFFFGNLSYISLNTTYRQAIGYQRAMDLLGKLRYVVWYFQNNLPTFVLYLLSLILYGVSSKNDVNIRSKYRLEKYLLVGMILVHFLIGMTPTPIFIQYLFGPLPMLVMLLMLQYDSMTSKNRLYINLIIVFCTLGILPNAMNRISKSMDTNNWDTKNIQIQSDQIRTVIRNNGQRECKILTLMPILSLESGCGIYPMFVTGPFAWRITPFVENDKLPVFKLVGVNELGQMLANDPPTGVLIGIEGGRLVDINGNGDRRLEEPFRDYAKSNQYKKIYLPNDFKDSFLWVRPYP